MLNNLQNIKFIGDLSLQDADLLAHYGKLSKNILEFGSGGSTHIFSQCGAKSILSVETDSYWIEATKLKLTQINNHTPVEFLPYTTNFNSNFDLIFVDGIDNLRREFAIETWKYLTIGGVMIFHDTRRFQDFQNAAWIAQLYFNEISNIKVNCVASDGLNSNITVIYKKQHEPYVNWNQVEGKPQWSYGTLKDDHELWNYDDKILSQQDEQKIYSQNGEDGILEKIFRYIGTTNKIAVEFGVSAHGSGLETNTRHLTNQGWNTYWFDTEPTTDLPQDCKFKQVLLTKDNIVSEFELQNIPLEFDLLSIDVDGNDYHLREALREYNPRVYVIEYNGCYAANEEYVMPYNEKYQWQTWQRDFGASILSLTKQADQLGYDLVYCESQGVNAFFVRKDINVFSVKTAMEAYKKLWWAD